MSRPMPPMDPVFGLSTRMLNRRQPTASPAWRDSHMLPAHQAEAKKRQAARVVPIREGAPVGSFDPRTAERRKVAVNKGEVKW